MSATIMTTATMIMKIENIANCRKTVMLVTLRQSTDIMLSTWPSSSVPSAAAVMVAGFVNVKRQNAAYARRAANLPSMSACWMNSVLSSVRQPATTAQP